MQCRSSSALDEYGVYDTVTLHVVLEVAAADFARTLLSEIAC